MGLAGLNRCCAFGAQLCDIALSSYAENIHTFFAGVIDFVRSSIITENYRRTAGD